MPQLSVHRHRHVTLARFFSAGSLITPRHSLPLLDDRGFAFWPGGPVLTVTEGSSVTVNLQRVHLDGRAPLDVSSSDPALLDVQGLNRTDGSPSVRYRLPNDDGAQITIRANNVRINNQFNYARLNVTWLDWTIHSLHAFVFRRLRIRVIPHRVTVRGRGAHLEWGLPPLEPAMNYVNAIWASAGIEFVPPAGEAGWRYQPMEIENDGLAMSGVFNLTDRDQQRRLFEQSVVPGAINIYFISYIRNLDYDPASRTIGVTQRPGDYHPSDPVRALPQPCILMPDRYGDSAGNTIWTADEVTLCGQRGTHHPELKLGLTLAHEIGHYLNLAHPRDDGDSHKLYPWSQRLLMHNSDPSSYLIPLCKRDHGPLDDNGVVEARLMAGTLNRPVPPDHNSFRRNLGTQRDQMRREMRQYFRPV